MTPEVKRKIQSNEKAYANLYEFYRKDFEIIIKSYNTFAYSVLCYESQTVL